MRNIQNINTKNNEQFFIAQTLIVSSLTTLNHFNDSIIIAV